MHKPNKTSKNSNTLPNKGILKQLSHPPKPQHPPKKDTTECALPTNGGRAHFDEMNVLQTYHPENKDYGHMKINEPDTPYNKYVEPEDDDTASAASKVKRGSVNYNTTGPIDPNALSKHLLASQVAPLKSSVQVDNARDDEEVENSREFKATRAAHYAKEFVKKSDLPND